MKIVITAPPRFACGATVLIATALFACTMPTSAQGVGSVCKVSEPTAKPLPVRIVPRGKLVGTLENGVQVKILELVDDDRRLPWARIDAPAVGWVYAKFLDCTAPEKTDPVEARQIGSAAPFLENALTGGTVQIDGRSFKIDAISVNLSGDVVVRSSGVVVQFSLGNIMAGQLNQLICKGEKRCFMVRSGTQISDRTSVTLEPHTLAGRDRFWEEFWRVVEEYESHRP